LAPPNDGAPPVAQAQAGMLIRGVSVRGYEQVPRRTILAAVRTRPGREFDPNILQDDVRALFKMRLFRDVRTYTEIVEGEVVVVFEVAEHPTLKEVVFLGNRLLTDRTLLKESGLKVGDAVDIGATTEAQQKLQQLYRTRGFPRAEVVITEGVELTDNRAVFSISEGPLQRIRWTHFEGNTVATDSRLKTVIKSKPGWAWYFFGGKVDHTVIDEDIAKLTAYYRNLGYFRARIGRDIIVTDDDGDWVDVVFVIDEGPRYKIRNVSLVGNRKFKSETLAQFLELNSGEEFNMTEMQKDVNTLRDIYGAQGHVYCNVTPDPRFLEEPGQLDLVYSIEEGAQYRVGRVNVHIAGDYPHTRENVIRNRISLQPGDVIDIRQIRNSETRLRRSELFLVEPSRGVSPYIKVEPLSDKRAAEALARSQGTSAPGSSTFRGQSPDDEVEYIDLNVYTPALREENQSGGGATEHLSRLPPITP